MSKRKGKITRELGKMGAAWATRDDKFCDPNDPLGDQIAGRKAYHIHPESSYPHQRYILRFDTLDEIEQWLNTKGA